MSKRLANDLIQVVNEVSQCQVCSEHLDPNPVIRVSASANVLIIGQAPGLAVHKTGIPWNDPSGNRLRQWFGIDKDTFYDTQKIAVMPMGFCYPGKGKSGDLPPRKECYEQWHSRLLQGMPNIETTILIGKYAQDAYLPNKQKTLTDNVKAWRSYAPTYIPLVHPSPRNTYWIQKNPWFEEEVVPYLQEYFSTLST